VRYPCRTIGKETSFHKGNRKREIISIGRSVAKRDTRKQARPPQSNRRPAAFRQGSGAPRSCPCQALPAVNRCGATPLLACFPGKNQLFACFPGKNQLLACFLGKKAGTPPPIQSAPRLCPPPARVRCAPPNRCRASMARVDNSAPHLALKLIA